MAAGSRQSRDRACLRAREAVAGDPQRVTAGLGKPFARGALAGLVADQALLEHRLHENRQRECAALFRRQATFEIGGDVREISSTANAFVLRGAVPVFVDIREDTLNLDETKIEEAITDRTRALLGNTYGGLSGPAVKPVALRIVYEAAQAVEIPIVADAGLADGACFHAGGEQVPAHRFEVVGFEAEVLREAAILVVTRGEHGSSIYEGASRVDVAAVAPHRIVDPTGVGDAFRAGFLMGLSWGCDLERCAQVGSLLAALVIETIGTQEFEVDRAVFVERFRQAYGASAAADIAPHLVA